jgi:hypothetical protein
MGREYPFKPATGVATSYLTPSLMQNLARLLRDEAVFVAADQTMPKVLEYAATREAWPHPDSVGVVDGRGVVVLATKAENDTAGLRGASKTH